jgi:hypothetical protein
MNYFKSQQDYDDYLELIEDLVMDLKEQSNVDAAYAKIAQKKKENYQKL